MSEPRRRGRVAVAWAVIARLALIDALLIWLDLPWFVAAVLDVVVLAALLVVMLVAPR